jgi:hypothetical protein
MSKREATRRIQIRLAGIGRVAKASGATTTRDYEARVGCLRRLYKQGEHQLLRDLKDGKFTVTELYAADLEKRLATLKGDRARLAQPLWATVDAWIPKPRPTKRRAKPVSIKRYKVAFTQLKTKAADMLPDTATVADIAPSDPDAPIRGQVDWAELDERWGGSGADWNHVRRAVSKFLSDTLGDIHHPFRRQVVEAIPIRPEPPRLVDLPVDLFWKIVRQAPEYVQPAFVFLAATSMDTGEYLATTETDLLPLSRPPAIRARGTKTDARDAVLRVHPDLWTWIQRAVPAPVQYKWLRTHWKRALAAAGADTSLRLKDLRHVGAQWAVEEGVPLVKIQKQLRHTNSRTTEIYADQIARGEVGMAVGNHMLRMMA